MKILTALLLSSALFAAGQVAAQGTAATLQDLDGKVLGNKGDGFASGKKGSGLKEGDRIVTLNKSSARIMFPDGCGVTLQENMTFVINSKLGCKALPVASTPAPAAAVGGPTATQRVLISALDVRTGALIGNAASNNEHHHNWHKHHHNWHKHHENRPISCE